MKTKQKILKIGMLSILLGLGINSNLNAYKSKHICLPIDKAKIRYETIYNKLQEFDELKKTSSKLKLQQEEVYKNITNKSVNLDNLKINSSVKLEGIVLASLEDINEQSTSEGVFLSSNGWGIYKGKNKGNKTTNQTPLRLILNVKGTSYIIETSDPKEREIDLTFFVDGNLVNRYSKDKFITHKGKKLDIFTNWTRKKTVMYLGKDYSEDTIKLIVNVLDEDNTLNLDNQDLLDETLKKKVQSRPNYVTRPPKKSRGLYFENNNLLPLHVLLRTIDTNYFEKSITVYGSYSGNRQGVPIIKLDAYELGGKKYIVSEISNSSIESFKKEKESEIKVANKLVDEFYDEQGTEIIIFD